MKEKKIDNEELMNSFYKNIVGIDPAGCVKLEGNVDNLEIKLGKERVPINKFLEKSVQVTTIDHFSTKQFNEKVISFMKGHIPYGVENLYLELLRVWGVIYHENKNVGIADRVSVYNGYPKLVSHEEIIKEPQKAFDNVIKQLPLLVLRPDLILVPPEEYKKVTVRFYKDFLEEHPVSTKSIKSSLLRLYRRMSS